MKANIVNNFLDPIAQIWSDVGLSSIEGFPKQKIIIKEKNNKKRIAKVVTKRNKLLLV